MWIFCGLFEGQATEKGVERGDNFMNVAARALNLADYGILQNEIQTQQIQRVFDEADRLGGLPVVFPRGTYITGTVDIKGASVYLEKGSVWKGSENLEDYRPNGFAHNEMHQTTCLIYSMHHDHISISGSGTIDLSGDAFYDLNDLNSPEYSTDLSEEQLAECPRKNVGRPSQPIFFYQCRDIVMDGITICNAPCWTVSFHDCENIRLTYLTIRNRTNLPNNDGMHFCGSRNVVIHGCNITAGDDCIALSSITDWNKACERFVISDCILTCSSKAIVLGYSHSIVRNITISNCMIYDSHRGICVMTIPGTGLIEHVLIQNVSIETRVRAGNWWGNGEAVAVFAAYHELLSYEGTQPEKRFDVSIRDIRFSNVSCISENAIAVIGEQDCVEDIQFDNLYFEKKESANRYIKGDRRIDVSPSRHIYDIPEGGEYWLYVHGAKNVTYNNVTVKPYHGKTLKVFSE